MTIGFMKRRTSVSGEREWVETVKVSISEAFTSQGLTVETQRRLPYAVYVSGYTDVRGGMAAVGHDKIESPGYQTDLLIAERASKSQDWVPRVAVEFKLGSITTHDALTYSAKAATHKSIHPYLRYGIVVGRHPGAVPRRLMRHGHQFDFMLTLDSERLSRDDSANLVRLLEEEVAASCSLSALMVGKSKIRLFHRKLVTK
jgi:hypothetical protein